MKLLILFTLLISTSIFAKDKNPLSKVDNNIVAEERLQAAVDFGVEIEADCAALTFTTKECNDLRAFVKTQKYNAKLKKYSHIEKLADARAVARQVEINCVDRLQAEFTSKGYAFNGAETCAELNAALLIHEPPVVE